MKKGGQLTLFIIVGIVVVMAIITFFLFSSDLNQNVTQDEKFSIIRENTQECFDQIYENALTLIGFQGGYSEVTRGLYNGFAAIPYYYEEGTLLVPSIEEVELELANYLDLALLVCVSYENTLMYSEELDINLSGFDMMDGDFSGYRVSYDVLKTTVDIRKTEVVFTTDLDMTVINPRNQTLIFEFKDSSKSIKSSLYDMHSMAKSIAEEIANNDELLCLTCIEEKAEELDFTVDLMTYFEPQDELVIITDMKSTPFIFQFLNKYKVGENESVELFLS